MLHINFEIFSIFKKKIGDVSLKYNSKSLKNCCVLKLCLRITDDISMLIVTCSCILFEIELCLVDDVSFLFCMHIIHDGMIHNKFVRLLCCTGVEFGLLH